MGFYRVLRAIDAGASAPKAAGGFAGVLSAGLRRFSSRSVATGISSLPLRRTGAWVLWSRRAVRAPWWRCARRTGRWPGRFSPGAGRVRVPIAASGLEGCRLAPGTCGCGQTADIRAYPGSDRRGGRSGRPLVSAARCGLRKARPGTIRRLKHFWILAPLRKTPPYWRGSFAEWSGSSSSASSRFAGSGRRPTWRDVFGW